MAFHITVELNDRNIARMSLSGELETTAAPGFMAEIEKAAAKQARRLVLFMAELSYMSSAGLRALVFARQKMGSDVDIFIVGAQESVLETIRMAGFHHSVMIQENYEADEA